MTGGSFAALMLINSNIFGLTLFGCGLTHYELKKLTKIKIYSSVLLENIPQIIFQGLYAGTAGVTNSVIFASLASVLSVMAAVLAYFINRDHDAADMVATHYYLALECNRLSHEATGISSVSTNKSLESASDITKEERRKVINRMGLRHKMSGSLARLWHGMLATLT